MRATNPFQFGRSTSESVAFTFLIAASCRFSDDDSHSLRIAEMMVMPSEPNVAAMLWIAS